MPQFQNIHNLLMKQGVIPSLFLSSHRLRVDVPREVRERVRRVGAAVEADGVAHGVARRSADHARSRTRHG